MDQAVDYPRDAERCYDVVGMGFGPSNLALAVAAREIAGTASCLFAERNPEFSWHRQMLLPGARMQISFLKDLALMRNPASRYTFLEYLRSRGRLQRFINLTEFFPYRTEYADYLKWVAADFAGQVRYGTEVVRVSPLGTDLFAVRLRDVADGSTRTVTARNVVVAPGGTPRIPPGVDPGVAIHSSEFLERFTRRWPGPDKPARVLVAGDGQSAAEIVRHLLHGCPDTEIHLAVSGYALRPSDNSPFVNEQFFSHSSERFRRQPLEHRTRELAELANANYRVVEPELLDELYRIGYLDDLAGRRRLVIHPRSRIVSAKQAVGGEIESVLRNPVSGEEETLESDALILATGYRRALNDEVFADLLPYLQRDAAGGLVFSESYRILTSPHDPGTAAGLYGQGLGETTFGLGDTLLSLLPFRSEAIVRDIAARLAAAPEPAAEPHYPPERHTEHDRERIHAVIDRFKFATIVSARAADDAVVTQVPLILDPARGPHGTLFGHMDRANPHTDLLDDRPVTVLFHGPSGYISPRVYASDQLPTWNSMTVQVRGRVRLERDPRRVVAGLCAIARMSERRAGPATLTPDDPRIPDLLPGIVAFEIEIREMVGRYKLSQDRDEADRRLAALELAESAGTGHRAVIGYVTGLDLDRPDPTPAAPPRDAAHSPDPPHPA